MRIYSRFWELDSVSAYWVITPIMPKHSLSPTALGTFKNCPRCFWLEKVKNIKRPRGIFPSLPGGMDAVIKTYFDKFRATGTLPPEIASHVEGKLVADQALLDKW